MNGTLPRIIKIVAANSMPGLSKKPIDSL